LSTVTRFILVSRQIDLGSA